MVKMTNEGVIKFISSITTDYILCLIIIHFLPYEKVEHLMNQIGITFIKSTIEIYCFKYIRTISNI